MVFVGSILSLTGYSVHPPCQQITIKGVKRVRVDGNLAEVPIWRVCRIVNCTGKGEPADEMA
jgi:hypothetical protein